MTAVETQRGPVADPARSHDSPVDVEDDASVHSTKSATMFHKALRMGRVEEKGIQPVPVDERQSTSFYQIFTVWFSINTNILG